MFDISLKAYFARHVHPGEVNIGDMISHDATGHYCKVHSVACELGNPAKRPKGIVVGGCYRPFSRYAIHTEDNGVQNTLKVDSSQKVYVLSEKEWCLVTDATLLCDRLLRLEDKVQSTQKPVDIYKEDIYW
jgi:hypothetical protein